MTKKFLTDDATADKKGSETLGSLRDANNARGSSLAWTLRTALGIDRLTVHQKEFPSESLSGFSIMAVFSSRYPEPERLSPLITDRRLQL